MAESSVRLRVRLGANEVEIEASPTAIGEVIDLIPKVAKNLPSPPSAEVSPSPQHPHINTGSTLLQQEASPEITLTKGESLSSILLKLFKEPWGRTPRRLGDVRSVLETYGLPYPKQSVAVALLRLAKSGKLRRFKGEGGEFVYTASTTLLAEGSSS